MGRSPAANAPQEEKPIVYMRFRPAWTYIDGIREFGQFFCERTFGEAEFAERATMVMQEMLENAVKYSITNREAELELSLSRRGTSLEISITSLPDAAHLGALKTELEQLYELSPEEAYLAAFERASNSSDGSRLGLARIRFEGHVDIVLDTLDDGRITLTARGTA